ncbi:MAG: MlaD family protein [Gordonia sp. (in: high G+C Gram-positive bacteria)]|uniref:MCE family protein n=1 Tax=Gordonia sp. (in: high G+C Gram-positive bacteria) TaxID=84139 RepID=UPI0039E46319
MKKRLKSSFDDRRLLWYGLIGTVVLIALVLGILGLHGMALGKKTYSADFAQAGGIRPGDKVRVAGIDVGQVEATKLAGDHVNVKMKVDNDVHVTDNGSAEIKMSTLLGQRFVDISLGNGDKPAPDDKIKNTAVPYDLQKTLEKGTPILAGINDEDLANSIRDLNDQLAGAPAVATPTIQALTDMSNVVNNRADQINQLIKDTNSVTDQVMDSQAQLSIIVGQGAQLAGKIQAREQLVTRLLNGVADLMTQSQQLAQNNQDQFAPIMANLNTMSQGLEKNRENLRKMLDILPVTARSITNLTGDGPYANGYLPWGIFPDNWLCAARVVDGC